MKKILAIILVVAMVFSMVGCGEKDPVETQAPTPVPATLAPKTEAPQTVAPTEAPETEAPVVTEKPDEWVTLAKPMGNTGDSIETLVLEDDNTLAVPAGDKAYKVDISSADGNIEITGAGYTGDITIYGEAPRYDLTINLPNAHVEFVGEAKNVYATTSATTFVAGKDAVMESLTINGGNAKVEGAVKAIDIPSTNTTTTSLVISSVAVDTSGDASATAVTVAGGNGAVVTTSETSNPTITNTATGTVVKITEQSKPTIVATTTDTYVKNETEEKVSAKTESGDAADVADTENKDTVIKTEGEVGSETVGSAVVEKPETENDSKDLTIDDLAKLFTDSNKIVTIPVGYTLTISEEFEFAPSQKADLTIVNFGIIAVNADFTNNGNVINYGAIVIKEGVTATNAETTGTITNYGTITVCSKDNLLEMLNVGGAIQIAEGEYILNKSSLINEKKATLPILKDTKLVGIGEVVITQSETITGGTIDEIGLLYAFECDVSLENITFDTISKTAITAKDANIIVKNCTINARENQLTGMAQNGIWVDGCTGVIENCEINNFHYYVDGSDWNYASIGVLSNAANVDVKNTKFSNVDMAVRYYEYVANSTGSFIDNEIVGSMYGIMIPNVMSSVVVKGNTITDTPVMIYISNYDNSGEMLILENNVFNATDKASYYDDKHFTSTDEESFVLDSSNKINGDYEVYGNITIE